MKKMKKIEETGRRKYYAFLGETSPKTGIKYYRTNDGEQVQSIAKDKCPPDETDMEIVPNLPMKDTKASIKPILNPQDEKVSGSERKSYTEYEEDNRDQVARSLNSDLKINVSDKINSKSEKRMKLNRRAISQERRNYQEK